MTPHVLEELVSVQKVSFIQQDAPIADRLLPEKDSVIINGTARSNHRKGYIYVPHCKTIGSIEMKLGVMFTN